jgi:ATP-dependent Lon protease
MGYTAESGVRGLARAIGSVCRGVAYQYATAEDQKSFKKVPVDAKLIEEALGRVKYEHQLKERIRMPGVAIGLAYTTIGGSALLVETTQYPGSGQIKQTGKLGDVMRESINTSISWIQGNASAIGLIRPMGKGLDVAEADESEKRNKHVMRSLLKNVDLHVHFPAAATPKDGPSAGVTITVALVSLLTARRVRSDFAMTGEISLQGLALPVGGIKEKCMAAHRNGITNVILPVGNKKDYKDVPEDVRKELKVHFAETVERYLQLALEREVDEKFRRFTQANISLSRNPIEVLAKL